MHTWQRRLFGILCGATICAVSTFAGGAEFEHAAESLRSSAVPTATVVAQRAAQPQELHTTTPVVVTTPTAHPEKIRSGEPIVAKSPSPVTIEINIAAKELRVYENDHVTHTYPVAIGQLAHQSIVMQNSIARIEWNPTWYPPDSDWAKDAVITPPGPKNPLGSVKIPLASGDIRIHGTNNEASVGRPASHGCFRMHNADVIALAWMLQTRFSEKIDPALPALYAKHRTQTYVVGLFVDVPFRATYAPIEIHDHELFLYPDVYGRLKNWNTELTRVLQTAGYDTATLTTEQIAELRAKARKGKTVVTLEDAK